MMMQSDEDAFLRGTMVECFHMNNFKGHGK